MTSLAVMLVTPLLMWVDFGWQPVAGSSGIEFMIRLSPQQLESLRNGEDVLSDLPPGMETVHTYRITTDPSELPNEGKPPRRRQTTLASTGQPVLDPITGQAVPSNFAQNNFGTNTLGTNNPYGQTNYGTTSYGQNSPGALSQGQNNYGTSTYLPASNSHNYNQPAGNTQTGPAFPNNPATGSNWNNSSTAWNTSTPTGGGWNQNGTGFNQLNSGTFPSPSLNSGYQSQQPGYGNYLAAPNANYGNSTYGPQPANYNQQARLDNGWNQPPNNYVTQPDYAHSPTAYRPGSASLAGVTQTRAVSPANWIAVLVALGLSLGANAYLGMLSMGLYNRCRVLLGQLRFSTLH